MAAQQKVSTKSVSRRVFSARLGCVGMASQLGVSVQTLYDLRSQGRGQRPEFVISMAGCGRSGPLAQPQPPPGEELIAEFSNRSRDIDIETDRLIEEYTAKYGRRPSPRTIVELRATATIATRPEKEPHSLAELTEGCNVKWPTRVLSAEYFP